MTTQTPTIESLITPELANDLFTPSIPTMDLCRSHGISIPDLVAIMDTDWFRETAEALDRAEQLRAAALAPDRRERALNTLEIIADQEPTTPSHTECIRRAASAILRATTPKRDPRTSPRATPEDPTPPNTTPNTPAPTDSDPNNPTPNTQSPPDQADPNNPTPQPQPPASNTHPPEPQNPLRNLRALRVENSESPSPSPSASSA